MDVDVHRQRAPAAQHRVVRQIQVEQMPPALSGGLVVAAVRQIREVVDFVDAVWRVPQLGTRRINGNRSEPHAQNARQQLFRHPLKVARSFRPPFRVT